MKMAKPLIQNGKLRILVLRFVGYLDRVIQKG